MPSAVENGIYVGNLERTASSELLDALLGDTLKHRNILRAQVEQLQARFPDTKLDQIFDGMDTRIISIAPMVLFDTMLKDLDIEPAEEVLAGLGLVMYSVSTHDDVVDEKPEDRLDIAGLIFAGNIAHDEGLLILTRSAPEIIPAVVNYSHMTNYTQTKIVRDLWVQPTDEETYLEAINTTRYWAEVGLQAAIVYAGRDDLHDFADQFSILYGKTCQIFDDIREIDDDVENGYWSLPISLAQENGWNIHTPDGKNAAIQRSHEIAKDYTQRAKDLCGVRFPALRQLADRLGNVGSTITY